MNIAKASFTALLIVVSLFGLSSTGYSHGDVQPQEVDITGLKPLGDAWLNELPYTVEKTPDQIKRAIEIGCSAYVKNCARCHGIGVISGGTAPDLRYLEKDQGGDEWFINRVRNGYYQNGITKMPKFEGLIPQEAMWAIRAFVNIRPEEDSDAVKPGLGNICPDIDYDKVTQKPGS